MVPDQDVFCFAWEREPNLDLRLELKGSCNGEGKKEETLICSVVFRNYFEMLQNTKLQQQIKDILVSPKASSFPNTACNITTLAHS